MSGIKVFGWTGARGTIGQTREIIATTSWHRAAEASDNSVGYLRKYGSKTENSEEWDLARMNPGVVLYRSLDGNPRKFNEGWQRADGQPVVGIEFDQEKRDLLRSALSKVDELSRLVGQGSGWAELRQAEINLHSAARELGIPQDQVTS